MNTLELWINKEKRRYYKYIVYSDLLGDRILLRNWGSLDSKIGGTMSQVMVDSAQEQALICSIRKKRLQHNYELVRK